MLSPKELKFLESHELCRLGLSTEDGMPHVTPVIYALDGEIPVIATDYGTKKLQILKENKKTCVLVDDERSGLMIQGESEIFERGEEYLRLLKILFARFEYYRKNPWGEGESPIIRVAPIRATSWAI